MTLKWQKKKEEKRENMNIYYLQSCLSIIFNECLTNIHKKREKKVSQEISPTLRNKS